MNRHDDQVRYASEDRASRVALAAAAYTALDGRKARAVMYRVHPCRDCRGWHIVAVPAKPGRRLCDEHTTAGDYSAQARGGRTTQQRRRERETHVNPHSWKVIGAAGEGPHNWDEIPGPVEITHDGWTREDNR